MRTSTQKLNPSLKSQLVSSFAQTFLGLKNLEEAGIFLQDFFNNGELEGFAKRLGVAYWLKKGRSYDNIQQNLKVSTATIATVQGLMQKPGFKLAIKKLEAEDWANVWAEKIKKFVRK